MSDNANRDKKEDLIAKLLAKAESTTPEEAEALTEHAERLMMKYGIEQAAIDARRAQNGGKPEEIGEQTVDFTGTYRVDMLEMAALIAMAIGPIQCYQSKGRSPETGKQYTRLYIVGFDSDRRQAETLVRSLEVQAMVAMRSWWLECRDSYQGPWWSDTEKQRARAGFLRGFGAGAAERIRANRSQLIEEAGSGTELALLDRATAVKDHLDGLGLKAGRARREPDAAGFHGGVAAGRNARTGEREMTQGRALAR